MSTTITIYFLESPFHLVLLVQKSSQSDQLMNGQKKKIKKIATLPQNRNLEKRIIQYSKTSFLPYFKSLFKLINYSVTKPQF